MNATRPACPRPPSPSQRAAQAARAVAQMVALDCYAGILVPGWDSSRDSAALLREILGLTAVTHLTIEGDVYCSAS